MKTRLWLILLVLLFCTAAQTFAATEPAKDASANQLSAADSIAPEVEEFRLIHADSMTLTRQKEKPQVFKGAVDIIMLDQEGSETRIEAEKVTLYYQQDQKKMDRMEAEGHVKITRAGTVATTELAVYHSDKDVIELLLDPHVTDSRGELTANKISIFMQGGEVVASGNVRGLLHPASFEQSE